MCLSLTLNGALRNRTEISDTAKLMINIFVIFPFGISRKNVSKRIVLPENDAKLS